MALRIFIIILLLWASAPSYGEAARLTLGVAPGSARDAGGEARARELAAKLTKALGDDVSVRVFDNSAQLGQWLGTFTMVDLGLVDAAFLSAHPGKFLVLGTTDQSGAWFVVTRQGATGDFPHRVTAVLTQGTRIPAPVSTSATTPGATPQPSLDGQASSPPAPAVAATSLTLGLLLTRDGLLRTPDQAKQFAAQLCRWLGVPVRARLFEKEQTLVDWFNRFQLIDLAVIDTPGQRDPLAGNYRPLQRLVAAGGKEGLLVSRRDLPDARVEGALRAFAAFGHDPSLEEILAMSTARSSAAPGAGISTVAAGSGQGVPAPPGFPRLPEAPTMPPTPDAQPSRVAAQGEPSPAVPVVAMSTATVAAVSETTPAAPAPGEPPAPAVAEVPAVIAQPDLPQELRPPGVPQPRPGRGPEAAPPAEESTLFGKLQDLFGRTPKPPPLLPPPDPEPGVVYVVPFITLMVPPEVREQAFDRFVDLLNQRGTDLGLRFVILKQGLNKLDRAWLEERKYVLGEIYGYVEESGCCSTDLRTRSRVTFYRAHLPDPALKYEYAVRAFFDHDQSTLTVERQKLANQLAEVLAGEVLKTLQH